MSLYLVNKPTDPLELRLLYPNMVFALKGVPAYGPAIYTDWDFAPANASLVLQQSAKGPNLDSYAGLTLFVEHSGYITAGKFLRWQNMGRPPLRDNMGKLVREAGRFHARQKAGEMYRWLSTVRVSNLSFLEDDPNAAFESIVSLLELPLAERLDRAEAVGWAFCLKGALTLLEAFYSPSISLPMWKVKRLEPLLSTRFQRLRFKQVFHITGDDRFDCMVLLALL